MAFTSKALPVLGVIGPSGAGKSTIIRRLVDAGIVEVYPTWTTRPPRPGELEEGIEHRFVSTEEFAAKEASGYFQVAVQLFDLPFRYGLPPIVVRDDGKIPVIMLRASLAPLLRKYYPDHIVYQIEDELSKIEERLREREKAGEPVGSRLTDYKKEVEAGHELANRVFMNTTIDETVRQVEAALKEDYHLA